MKTIPKQLFRVFLFAVILSIAATCVYYNISQKSDDYTKTLPKIMENVTFLNIIIFVMTLPALFLVNPPYWNNRIVRFLLYFAGSIVFIITALTMKLSPPVKIVYLMTGGIFLVVHSIFYYLLVKKR
ncbi:hypothetical protein G7092_09230 [Mucilaginibacter sp. HC2]|uniref:hypothetical protein n=1 Tax=Mucilaginibacter inviolabilis TaxID=2714892 RepID=UPI00140A1C58|nr:hypothetical protein [Mucilaginibacter inviolabilis]NHA03977.1 hypothetical protein [Mucilaginibacter inviolabilis]